VYNEYEVEGVLVSYSIKNEHGLYGKVPRTGTIGSWYDDGNGTYDEGDECTTQS
jgi:hypothetical protein